MNIEEVSNRIKLQFTDQNAKKFFTSFWRDRRIETGIVSTGFCYLSSHCFMSLIDKPEYYQVMKYSDKDNELDGHFWVIKKSTQEIIDLTGDQFVGGYKFYGYGKKAMDRRSTVNVKRFVELVMK